MGCQFQGDTTRLTLWKELSFHLTHMHHLHFWTFVFISDANIQVSLLVYDSKTYLKPFVYKLLYYFLLFCLKTCLGITYTCDLILTGVFFFFKQLIQGDKFKGEQEIWLRVDWEKELTHGLSWEQALYFFIEQIDICLIPIGLGLFKTDYWVETKLFRVSPNYIT